MRPIRLIMNAFGPYRGKVDLDFTKFDASSIYLISGPTGAGKTTIFDGISYALYNKASGGQREVDMLKSQFATDEDLCFVDFTFDLGNTTYRIKRSPKQRALGARGNPINHQADVELFKDGVSIEQGTMNVDKVVENLLGITYDQFNQIVLLPQGEFRKLLLSTSLEKEEIFRNIFGTEMIQRFQSLLKDKTQELNKSYKEYGLRLNQSISGIDTEADDQLKQAIAHENYDEILVILKEYIASGRKELGKIKNDISKLNAIEKENNTVLDLLKNQETFLKKKTELKEESEVIEDREKALELHEQASTVKVEEDKLKALEADGAELAKQLAESKESLLEVKATLEKWLKKQVASKKEESQLDAIREKIKKLENEATKFEELSKKEAKILELEKAAKASNKQATELTKEEAEFAGRLKDVKRNLSNVPIWRKDLENLQKQLTEVKETSEANEKEKDILEKIVKLQKSLAEQIEKSKKIKKKYQDSEQLYEEARQHYFGNLAGVLAAELTEEEPCPVCGSIHHPTPAPSDTNGVTQEKLAEYETIKDANKTVYTQHSQTMNHTAALIEEEKETLEGRFNEDYSKAVAVTIERAEALKAERVNLETKILKVENFLKEESTWQKEEDQIQEDIYKNQLAIQQLKSAEDASLHQIADLDEEVEELKKVMTHETVDEVLKQIDTKMQRIKNIQEEAASIQKALEKENDREARLETSISMYDSQMKKNKNESKKQVDIFNKLIEKYAFDASYRDFVLNETDKIKYNEQIATYKEELSYNNRQLKSTEEALAKYEEVRSVEEIENKLEETISLREAIQLNQEKIIRETGIHEKTYNEIEVNLGNSKEILEPLKVYKELSEIANGSTNRTNKVSFERYVLSIYFSEILQAANHRFEKMTNGRFELVRNEDKAKYGAAAGLELNVFDRHSGKERNVTSLSGGETFKASLALALGLSDVIQSQQGGVRVDTLFIDEGFGTLDAESLEMAIETLMELQSTGRLIGIISHVDELKDRIPAKIVVKNKQEGSHALIEVE